MVLPTDHYKEEVRGYLMLKDFAEYIVYTAIGLDPETHLAKALDFFIYDSIKIFILLRT